MKYVHYEAKREMLVLSKLAFLVIFVVGNQQLTVAYHASFGFISDVTLAKLIIILYDKVSAVLSCSFVCSVSFNKFICV
jgi:membrane-associated HD superfamily phosphohydrolase